MKILVTGGGGFLGLAVCKLLKARGDEVVSYSRKAYPELESLGVIQVQGDLANLKIIAQAAIGCEAIIHTAAKAGIWGSWKDYLNANILGTQNVIRVARDQRISRLVYTSSPSVVFGGADMENVNESAPYPQKYLAHYPKSKAIAEQEVIAASGSELGTVSLRPHLIWGPGDHHLVPRILNRAHRLRRIGNRDVIIDSTYIDNAAQAHIQALDRLAPQSLISGKAYFISNGEPWKLWELVNAILKAGDKRPVEKVVSSRFAYAIGAVLEIAYGVFGIQTEPPMTRFLAKELSTSHWFDLSKAKSELGYKPGVSMKEGLARLEKWLSRD
jgi:2-alkyl-3-oxoalkanoate reductase